MTEGDRQHFSDGNIRFSQKEQETIDTNKWGFIIALILLILFTYFVIVPTFSHAESAVMDSTDIVDSIIISYTFLDKPSRIDIVRVDDSICFRDRIIPPADSMYGIRLYGTYRDLVAYSKKPHYRYSRVVLAYPTFWWR